jgi:hypothetical protein
MKNEINYEWRRKARETEIAKDPFAARTLQSGLQFHSCTNAKNIFLQEI